ncbi:MAG: hypothetical protein KDB54_00690 [Solirubrobacterales bacterium]|nr:hypothetical protein [Solirubrobacterales bacterium]MCB0859155.1 hypothetical protein [Solirubrobacterales bacterium]
MAVLFACLTIQAQPANAGLEKTAEWGGSSFAAFLSLQSVALDSNGNAYVSEYGQNRIIRVGIEDVADLNWQVSSMPDPARLFDIRIDLAIDDSDHIYATDNLTGTIRKFSTNGDLLASWTPAVPDGTVLQSIAWESGSVWVLTNTEVLRFAPDGTPQGSWGGFESSCCAANPIIRGDGNGHLVIAALKVEPGVTSATKSVYKFDPDGTLISKWSLPAVIIQQWPGSYPIGYSGLAVDGSGDIWVSSQGMDPAIQKIGPGGLEGPGVDTPYSASPNAMAIDTGGNFWTVLLGGLKRIDASGDVTGTWGKKDFPRYAFDTTGQVGSVAALAAGSDGTVGVFDYELERVHTFTAAGDPLTRVEDIIGSPPAKEAVNLYLADDGTIEIFNRVTEKLTRFDSDGNLLGETDFPLEGAIRDFNRDPSGGYVAVGGNPTRIVRFDSAGTETASWPSVSSFYDHGGLPWYGGKVVADSSGRIYATDGSRIDAYSSTGDFRESLKILEDECVGYGAAIMDLAVDSEDNLYALVQPQDDDGQVAVFKFNPDLQEAWSEETPGYQTHLAVGPDGSIYLGGRGKVSRYTASEPLGSLEPPVCEIEPVPPVGDFKVRKVVFGPGRHWAKVRVYAPEKGRITLSGRKAITRRVTAVRSGVYPVSITVRPRYLMTARKVRRFKVSVRIGFVGPNTDTSRALTIRLKSRLRNLRR